MRDPTILWQSPVISDPDRARQLIVKILRTYHNNARLTVVHWAELTEYVVQSLQEVRAHERSTVTQKETIDWD